MNDEMKRVELLGFLHKNTCLPDVNLFYNLDTRNDKMKRIKFLGLFGFWYNHIVCGVCISYLENQVWFSDGELSSCL
jgi:hypothetical protein